MSIAIAGCSSQADGWASEMTVPGRARSHTSWPGPVVSESQPSTCDEHPAIAIDIETLLGRPAFRTGPGLEFLVGQKVELLVLLETESRSARGVDDNDAADAERIRIGAG